MGQNMTKLVKIGTSYGVRIPKIFIEKANLKDADIDLKLLKNGLLLTPSKKYRVNWDSKSLRQKAQQDSDCAALQEDFLGEDIKDWDW